MSFRNNRVLDFLKKLWPHSHPRRQTHSCTAQISLKGPTSSAYINLLPSEILVAEIFPLILDGSESWPKSILVLAAVCVKWKSLVHSTPLLWSRCIPIRTWYLPGSGRPLSNGRLVKKYLTAVGTWLSRSAPLPIPVSLNWYNFQALDEFSRALSILISAAARWDSVCINAQSNTEAVTCAFRALARIPEGTFQSLTEVSLTVSHPRKNGAVEYAKPLLAFMSAPRLRSVRLFGVLPGNTDLVSMPWTQLTHLSISCPALSCLETLVKCLNVVSAFINCLWWDPSDGPTTLTTTTLRHLETLRMSVCPGLMDYLGHLNLPALRTLELFYPDDDDDMVWPFPESFRQFPLTSAPNLQHLKLSLYGQVLTSPDLCALLRCTPALTQLDLSGYICADNGLFDALSADVPRTQILVPRLEILRLYCAIDFDGGSLRAMIASRCQTEDACCVMPLQTILFKGVNLFGDNLDPVERDGLEIRLLDPSVLLHVPISQ
ncbi:hypothetical protein MVEN_01495900 [Mycena venus]|uniref:F-box domain-containing protein n=1 Tax=Mycena venus TaxID=2733690 RepID=A0A8H6XVM4_9AGAR|nr:hypothetical protein MVEN_01495900 [Mycena venus]